MVITGIVNKALEETDCSHV